MSDTSGPAFPMTGMTVHGGQAIQAVYQSGMTLRDYFAAKALSVLDVQAHVEMPAAENLARSAYKIADAMLKERAK